MKTVSVQGTICPGYQIASKGSTAFQELPSNVYKDRSVLVSETVLRQLPHFVKAGVPNADALYGGTINVDISPNVFQVLSPDHEICCVWIDGIEETFWLVAVEILFEGKKHKGYLYYPCVSEQHKRRDTMMEILAPKINGIKYGKRISILAPSAISIEENIEENKNEG